MLTEKKPKAERFLHKSVEPALEHYLNIKVNGFPLIRVVPPILIIGPLILI